MNAGGNPSKIDDKASVGLGELCAGCFQKVRQDSTCQHCDFDSREVRPPIFLPLYTRLDGQYLIGRQLGSPGGFGITYLAWHELLRSRVAIKEFLPRQLAARGNDGLSVAAYSDADAKAFNFGLEAFCREAQILEQLDHRHIVRVRALFMANGTAYMVMNYYDGETLDELLHRKGGRISDSEALALMAPILSALREEVHARSYLHRDISPQNIYLAKFKQGQMRPLLLDFGAARLALGGHTQSLSVILKPGYAPYEQYGIGENRQGPWTDVYACAATLYRAVTGMVPSPAFERLGFDTLRPPTDLVPDVSESFSAAVMKGLEVLEGQRPSNIAEFQALLDVRPETPRSGDETGLDETGLDKTQLDKRPFEGTSVDQAQLDELPLDERQPTPFLRILRGEGAAQEIPLDLDEYIILGRDPSVSHVVLGRQELSRQHCALRFDSRSQHFEIEDLKTSNGTFLVSDQGEEHPLPPGKATTLASGQQFFLVDRETQLQVIIEQRTTQPELPMSPPQPHHATASPTLARPDGCLMILLFPFLGLSTLATALQAISSFGSALSTPFSATLNSILAVFRLSLFQRWFESLAF